VTRGTCLWNDGRQGRVIHTIRHGCAALDVMRAECCFVVRHGIYITVHTRRPSVIAAGAHGADAVRRSSVNVLAVKAEDGELREELYGNAPPPGMPSDS
jgi:hypothetical protein